MMSTIFLQKMRQSHWLVWVAKIVIGSWNNATTKLKSSVTSRESSISREATRNFQQKQNSAAKDKYFFENPAYAYCSQFCHQSNPVILKTSTLLWIVKEFKNTFGKLAAVVNIGGHSIRVLNEEKVQLN